MILLREVPMNVRIASCFILSMGVHWIEHNVRGAKYVILPFSLKIINGGCLLAYHHH